MNNRELLEMAANAAGMKGWQWVESWGSMAEKRLQGGFYFDRYWNPLEDDGDALRLAVKLHILFRQPPSMPGWVRASGEINGRKVCADERLHADPLTATRRAIVRAAAEIGKKMNEH